MHLESIESVTASSVMFVESVADLARIFDPTVSAVILRRPPPPDLREDILSALGTPDFSALVVVAPDARGRRQLAGALTEQPHIAADVHTWVEVLADLTGFETFGVRVRRLVTAMCPRFHVDNLLLRLVCTYHGPATECLGSEHVDRRRLGRASVEANETDPDVVPRAGVTHVARTGDIVLLKGESWPNGSGRGAVHRSPTASAANPRLVMTLDLLE